MFKLLLKAFCQREQVLHIGGGVVDHLLRQRTLRPVLALVFFVKVDIIPFCQHRIQPACFKAQKPACQLGVKKIVDVNFEIAIKRADIIIRPVKYFLNVTTPENRLQYG